VTRHNRGRPPPGSRSQAADRQTVSVGTEANKIDRTAQQRQQRGAAPIATLRKNAMEEIRVELSEFNGHDLINIRVWAEPRDGGSERIPTKAGIACRVTLLPELIKALRQAEAEAQRQGLLP
jgi:Transcriptional Coactivator p15 (PC4)